MIDLPGRHVENHAHAERAGDFWWCIHNEGDPIVVGMGLLCPACGEVHSVAIKAAAYPGHRGWNWNGDRERPTLTPSIWFKDGHLSHGHDNGCRWHGHLTDGVWRTV